ncbi:MAG TPA: bifunctional 4-hydroxy-2-oxoglutarate aldolase/2-dehydro-3-deoxy-phosphogluconate aldolase [Vicinamibacterales bacterium]|nr:bifunctional 4-hydroxy-2-oxoglutarate aldolase/2-dehydro-3-deoxy-phosphogluconate aldolase [Vicinamibacterales bacterium]
MVTARAATLRLIEATGVVAVIRLDDPAALRQTCEALAAGGVRALEVTMTVPGAVTLIEQLAGSLPADFAVGAGTVLDAETARKVIAAGARFVVSPVFRPAMIDVARRHDVPVMPGCFTPTEILAAWDAGADIVKVFPATALGPTFFRDIHGPLPQIRLMPTGGVTRENAGDWIRAGAVAIGVGTALVDKGAIKSGKFDVIAANARHFIEAVRQARIPAAGVQAR